MPSYYLRGEVGDILYSWFWLQEAGLVADFTINGPSQHGSFDQFAALKPLANQQPYLKSFSKYDLKPPEAEDLRHWIDGGASTGSPNIIRPYFKGHNTDWPGYRPWLTVTQIKNLPEKLGEYTVINVTNRYRDSKHRWGEFLPAGEMLFLGLKPEYDEFAHHLGWSGYGDAAKRLKYHPTSSLLDAASIISGAKAFFGNASACLALAQGVGLKEIYVEVAQGTHATCLFGHEVILNGATVGS